MAPKSKGDRIKRREERQEASKGRRTAVRGGGKTGAKKTPETATKTGGR